MMVMMMMMERMKLRQRVWKRDYPFSVTLRVCVTESFRISWIHQVVYSWVHSVIWRKDVLMSGLLIINFKFVMDEENVDEIEISPLEGSLALFQQACYFLKELHYLIYKAINKCQLNPLSSSSSFGLTFDTCIIMLFLLPCIFEKLL